MENFELVAVGDRNITRLQFMEGGTVPLLQHGAELGMCTGVYHQTFETGIDVAVNQCANHCIY